MYLDRRGFLIRTGLTLAAGALATNAPRAAADRWYAAPRLESWADVRGLFRLDPDYIHLGGLYLASHPAPVREAIELHRRGLDENPVVYLQEQGGRLEAEVLQAAALYLGVAPTEIALTDSTTMGLGLLYNGLALRPDQEILTTRHDFSATHESLRLKAARSGATIQTIALYDQPAAASVDEIVARLAGAIRPETRLIAVTWVHSSTGVKLPISAMAEAVARANAGRDAADQALLCVDGVHGLGVEDVALPDLGADFFVAGTHKWLFGPRGTGFVWGRSEAWPAASPTIPSFSGQRSAGAAMTPGGFHSFEHRWALAQAFQLHLQVGKAAVAARIHALNRQLKEALTALRGVTVYTPLDEQLSAGLVCFDLAGRGPQQVVQRLRDRHIIATTTPYSPSHARLAPGLLNTPEEVEAAVREIATLG